MFEKEKQLKKPGSKNAVFISFICTGNTCRSYIAEAIATHLLKTVYFKKRPGIKDRVIIGSAGTDVLLSKIPVNTYRVLEKLEIPNIKFRPKPVDASMIKNSDLILTMATSHKKNIKAHFTDTDSKKVFTLIELANIILYLESEDIFNREATTGNKNILKNNAETGNDNTLAPALWKIDFIKDLKTDLLIKPDSMDIEDPYGRSINEYLKAARLIKENILTIFNYLF